MSSDALNKDWSKVMSVETDKGVLNCNSRAQSLSHISDISKGFILASKNIDQSIKICNFK